MPVIPLGDDNHHRSNHWLNWTFIIAGVGVLAYALIIDRNFSLAALEPFLLRSDFVPGFDAETVKRLGTSLFTHQNPILLCIYLYMLWMLGDNVEYIMGHFRYLVFFFLTGFGTLIAQFFWMRAAGGDVGNIHGFTGAAFAVMGAYIACFPNIKVDVIKLNTSLFHVFEETTLSVKWLPAIYMMLCFIAGVYWNYESIPSFWGILDWPETRILALQFCAFWVGYVLYYLFRDSSVVIDLPLHKRQRERKTDKYDWHEG